MMEKRMLVAKNLPDCAEDTLINFLEVICDNGVETIDYFDDRINHIALVTMEDDIADVSKSHAKASRRKLDGHQVELVEVGAPVGLVVKELPEHVKEEELRSYFESSESGGRHGVVEQCKIYTTCHAATVLINDSDVVTLLGRVTRKLVKASLTNEVKVFYMKSILGKVEHDIVRNEHPTTVSPFYQEFHNEVLGLLEGLQEQQGQITHD